MSLALSSDCECDACFEGTQIEPGWHVSSEWNDGDCLCSRSRKKSTSSSGTQHFSTRPENNSEGESEADFSQKSDVYLNPEDVPKKLRPLREVTVQELLTEFGDSCKCQPSVTSVSRFRDQVVKKFRRALYYSGIWVEHVQGCRLEQHLSATYFKKNPGSLQRLVPWLKRELMAVYGDYGYTVRSIQSTILHHMTQYDLDSEFFIHLLDPYLQQYTHQFLHEFIHFVHSPYTMETYDQKAIYKCPSSLLWVKKKYDASTYVVPLPKDQDEPASQREAGQSTNTQNRRDEERRPLLGLRYFTNSNSSSRKLEILEADDPTGSHSHGWFRHKPESGDHNEAISSDHTLLKCVAPRNRVPGLLSPQKLVQEKKTEGAKSLSGHSQDLRKCESAKRTVSTPSALHQGQPWKPSLRERKDLNLHQQVNSPKCEAEKVICPESLPKIIAERLPGEGSSVRCKPRRRDPSCGCLSETALQSKSERRKRTPVRKKRIRSIQPCHPEVAGLPRSRRVPRQSRSRTRRSKSWCGGRTKRSVSSESSNRSVRGSHRGVWPTAIRRGAHTQEKLAGGWEPPSLRASAAAAQHRKLSSAAGGRLRGPAIEDPPQAGTHTHSPSCPCVEKHRLLCNPEGEQKLTFPRPRKATPVLLGKSLHLCTDAPKAEVSD